MTVGSLNLLNMKHTVKEVSVCGRARTDNLLAGYTYCAIAALSLLGGLPKPSPHQVPHEAMSLRPGLTNIHATIRWLVSRQVEYVEEEEDALEEPEVKLAGVYRDGPTVPGLSFEDSDFVGFNGRCNKSVDTCYAFWVNASLNVCSHLSQVLVVPWLMKILSDSWSRRGTAYPYSGNTAISTRANSAHDRRIWQNTG